MEEVKWDGRKEQEEVKHRFAFVKLLTSYSSTGQNVSHLPAKRSVPLWQYWWCSGSSWSPRPLPLLLLQTLLGDHCLHYLLLVQEPMAWRCPACRRYTLSAGTSALGLLEDPYLASGSGSPGRPEQTAACLEVIISDRQVIWHHFIALHNDRTVLLSTKEGWNREQCF